MTPPASLVPGERDRTVIRAGAPDLDVLSQVIASAFHDLAPSRWVIGDPAGRRQVFPGYFRLHLEHALARGVVHTTPGRTAAALWIPASADATGPPDGYDARLAAATSLWTSRFRAFDAALDHHHPAGTAHWHLAILAVRRQVKRGARLQPGRRRPRPDREHPGRAGDQDPGGLGTPAHAVTRRRGPRRAPGDSPAGRRVRLAPRHAAGAGLARRNAGAPVPSPDTKERRCRTRT